MAQGKNSPIIYVEDFIESRGMRSLIGNQTNTQTGTIDNTKINGKNGPKVKTKDYIKVNPHKRG